MPRCSQEEFGPSSVESVDVFVRLFWPGGESVHWSLFRKFAERLALFVTETRRAAMCRRPEARTDQLRIAGKTPGGILERAPQGPSRKA